MMDRKGELAGQWEASSNFSWEPELELSEAKKSQVGLRKTQNKKLFGAPKDLGPRENLGCSPSKGFYRPV